MRARFHQLLILGMVIPPLLRNSYNRHINPYYKVDDHPYHTKTRGEFRPSMCSAHGFIPFAGQMRPSLLHFVEGFFAGLKEHRL